MTHQEYYEKVFHEYHQAGIDFLDMGIESSEKHELKISSEECIAIKNRFEKANEEYFDFLGYLNRVQPNMADEFNGLDI